MKLEYELTHPRRDGGCHAGLLQQVGWLGGRPGAALIVVPWELREVRDLGEPAYALVNQFDVDSQRVVKDGRSRGLEEDRMSDRSKRVHST
jgi:hypothetical protein